MALSTLTLIFGLSIPWVAGYFCMRTLQSYDRAPGSLMIALSAGLFLGYAAVSLILTGQNLAIGSINRWLPLLILAPIAVLALWHGARQPVVSQHPDADSSLNGAARWLAIVLAGGILIHLAYSLLELLTQPLFPWDAWNVWTYRAKAWFYDGSLTPMLDGEIWMDAAEPFRYTSTAINYPYLPSLMHLWAALSLGGWHETLINLPVLACGLGIALGLAGSIRRAGGSILVSLGTVYLLFSIPLMGVHTSLGGYGDIWMAGFAGTGMTLFLCGMLVKQRFLQLAGALLLLAGCMVKVEGTVWLFAALAIYLILRLSAKQLIILLISSAVFLSAAALTGITWLELPMVGALGYRDGLLLVPMRSGVEVGLQDVGSAYLWNAFVLNSWHLLWPLVLLVAGFVVLRTNGALRKLTLTFFAVFVATQVAIFGLTSQGQWARDFTAINRLPLHMLSPILFLVAMAIEAQRPALTMALSTPRTRRSLLIGLAGAMLISVLGVLIWQAGNLGFAPAERQVISPADLNFVLGSGEKTSHGVRIENYQDGIALLSSGPTSLDANQLSQLHFELTFDEDIVSLDQAPAFFWRRADQLREVSRMTLINSGYADLAQSEDWTGEIVEYGFFFVENRGEPAEIARVELEGNSLANTLRQIPRQWFAFTGWSQASSNWLPGGAYEQVLYLTLLVTIIVLLGGFLGWLLGGKGQLLQLTLLCFMAGWIILDARWLLERSWQAQLSQDKLFGLTVEERIAEGHMGKFYPYLQRLLTEELGPERARILIILDPEEEPYFGLRSRYELLPHAANLRLSMPPLSQIRTVDYVLFLGDYSSGNPAAYIDETTAQRWERLGVNNPRARRLMKLVDESPEGTLFRVESGDS